MAAYFCFLLAALSPYLAEAVFDLANVGSVCYEPWGCFSSSPPFTNTVGFLPLHPDALGVRFFLHTRDAGRQLLDPDWPASRLQRAFDSTKNTRVIIHGYSDSGDNPWVVDMTARLLDKADQNVLVVDWGPGSYTLLYPQAASNIRLVARMLAAMLRRLMQIGAQPSSFHLIGHSLGAHTAGYAGSELPGIGRITGLDPAGPLFDNTSPPVRLDPSDATFVDVIHTHALSIGEMGLGYDEPCGSVDFYPNGGQSQPGCYRTFLQRLLAISREWSSVLDVMGCDHMRAIHLFLDSISGNCPMLASSSRYPYVLRDPRSDVTPACTHCVTMGYDVSPDASGVYHLRTRSAEPFCVQ